ncbi:MAG TPA: transporter [Candidatus Acidoferrales bacterium]|nr:transporter [Candidatus Acidoferrales bacterium]
MRRNDRKKRASIAGFFVGLLLLLVLALPALGQIRGVYSPGSTLTGGGTVPGPGLSYSNQLWYGSSDQLKDSNGKTLPIVVSLSTWTDNNSLVYVPKLKFLGANLEFMVDIAFSNGRYFASSLLSTGPSASGSGTGLTNTNFVPLDLGWHFKWADLQTGYSVYAPTGPYVPGATTNVSSGFWTNSWQTGTTIYVTKSKALQISVFNVYAWNGTQEGTGIRPGQNDSVDYSVSETISLSKGGKWSVQVGPAGYGQWQTTKNTGQSPAREALKYGVDAVGFTLNLSSPFKGLYLQTGDLWEYGARNTFQGRTMTVTAGLQF